MKRTSTDAEYLDSGKLVIDADGIPLEPAVKNEVEAELAVKADKSYVDDTKWPRGAFSITTLPNMDDAPEGVVTVNTAQRSMFWGLPGGHLGFVVTYSSTLFKAQVFYGITSTGLQEYTRKYGSSGWSEWYRTDDQIELAKSYTDNTVEGAGKKRVHIPLNRPWGDGSGHTRSYARRSCRIPLNLQVPTTGGIRVGFNNVEFLTETIYTTPVVIEGVFVGKSKRGADGELTGEFDGQPIPLLDSPLTLPADGSTVFTPWGAEDMTLDRDTIISYGFQSDGEGVFLYNQGVSWQTELHTDAGRLTPLYSSSGGGSPSASSPLGVSVELYTKAPRVLVIGDSRAVGLATGKPLIGSPASIAAASGWVPRIHAIGGSRLRQWAANTLIWDEVAQSGADRVILILGSNDIFGSNGATLEELKGYFLTVVGKIREVLGEVPIFTMELYPRFITPAPELVQIMEEFNAWTYGLPGGIDGVIPIDNLIDPSTGAVHAKWMSDDNVHLSMAGNVRLAQNFQIS